MPVDLRGGSTVFADVNAVVFDKDGTLADTRAFLATLARRRAATLARVAPVDYESVLSILGVTSTGIDPEGLMAVGSRGENVTAIAGYLAAQGHAWLQAKTTVESAFAAAEPPPRVKAQQTPLYDRTLAMLSRLVVQPVQIGILSSDTPDNVKAFVEGYSLDPYVDAYLGTQEGEPPKPSSKLLQQLCERLSTSPARVVLIGDSSVDQQLCRNAQAAGFIAVADAWGIEAVSGADGVLRSWNDLTIVR